MTARLQERQGSPEDGQENEDKQDSSQQEGASSQEDADHDEAQSRRSPSGKVVYKAICAEGADELSRPSSALFWSGLAAGMSMGFSLVAEGLLRAHLPHAGWTSLVASFGYSMGFVIVILGRQQLFTENTLTVILPLLTHRDARTLLNVLRLWAVVFIANIIGTAAFAAVIGHSNVFDPAVRHAFEEIGHRAMEQGFTTVLLRGIFAGWLIALMVWLLPFAESFRVLVIILLTYLVGLAGLSHVIAGAVETLYITLIGQKGFGQWLIGFLLPALLGNIIGGVTLVAVLNYAQVKAGDGGEDV